MQGSGSTYIYKVINHDGLHVVDIDECLGANDCQQICLNTAGSYYCECKDGFILDSNEHSCKGGYTSHVICVVIYFASSTTVTSACTAKKNCSDLCAYTNGTSTCFCFSGFVLSSDQMTCTGNDMYFKTTVM